MTSDGVIWSVMDKYVVWTEKGRWWHVYGVCSGIFPGYEWYQIRSGFMVEDASASGHVFRKLRLRQRAIARKTLGAWDDVIRPFRVIIFDDWPITLKWDAFYCIKGERQGGDTQTNDELTANERQTNDKETNRSYRVNRPIDKSCIGEDR